jgi:hypothetical protein
MEWQYEVTGHMPGERPTYRSERFATVEAAAAHMRERAQQYTDDPDAWLAIPEDTLFAYPEIALYRLCPPGGRPGTPYHYGPHYVYRVEPVQEDKR